jgi:hypothetical protein
MKYFNLIKQSDLNYTAVILYPSHKFIWFEEKWGQYDRGLWVKDVKESFRRLYNRYKASWTFDSSLEDEVIELRREEENDYLKFITVNPHKRQRLKPSINEYDRYFKY